MRPELLAISLFLCWNSCNSQQTHESIILINVGSSGRDEIADLVSQLNKLKPNVIALDLQFAKDQAAEIDNKLINALDECNNLVMVSIIANYSPQNINHERFTLGCLPKFTANAQTGFANLLPEDGDPRILRRFALYEYVDGVKEYSFAFRAAYEFDSIKATEYLDSHLSYNEVNFTKGLRKFRQFTLADFLKGRVEAREVEGKMVLIGFLGPGKEDKFIARLSAASAETQPNIYGLEFHAQVIAQILQL